MVKEKESQRYLQDRLASFVDPLSLAIAFFEVFDKKEITSLDPYPELNPSCWTKEKVKVE